MPRSQRRRELGHSKEFDLKNGSNATPLVDRSHGVTLVGGGVLGAGDLDAALARAPGLVAVDGGARTALAAGHAPDAVIGDMDSIDAATAARIPTSCLHKITEQESTDFDKALRHVRAPLTIAVGFSGARVDHELAAYHTLIRWPGKRCVMLAGSDLVFAAPPELALDVPVGTRVSLFPMSAVTGRSEGLVWPIDGLDFHPATRIGTSNAASAARQRLRFDGPGMLVILPRSMLDRAIAALAGT